MYPIFLTLDEVIEIHRDMIERYGESPGIRDEVDVVDVVVDVGWVERSDTHQWKIR